MPPVAFFSLPTRAWELAVGGLVALTADQWRRLPPRAAAIAGWAGLALILLACTRLSADHALSGYRRAVAGAGRRAGDRRGLCHACPGMRPHAGVAADAGDRPGVLLVVSVALAGAVLAPLCRRPAWLTARWRRSGLPWAGGAHRCVSSRTRCDSLLPCAGRPAAVSRWAAPPPRSQPVWVVALLVMDAYPGRAAARRLRH